MACGSAPRGSERFSTQDGRHTAARYVPAVDELTQSAGKSGFLAHGRQVVEPAFGQGRAVHQHLVQMQDFAALGDDVLGQRARASSLQFA